MPRHRAYTDAIDLLVSDIIMPRMTGPQLAEHIRQERPNTALLLMSGHASGVLMEYAKSHDFIQKPFEPRKFIERVGESLKRSKGAAAE